MRPGGGAPARPPAAATQCVGYRPGWGGAAGGGSARAARALWAAGGGRVGPPQRVLEALSGYARVLLALDGCAVAAALAYATLWQVAPLIEAAAVLAVALGWWLKFALVVRLSHNQGFALPMTPVRGVGVTGPGARPGW